MDTPAPKHGDTETIVREFTRCRVGSFILTNRTDESNDLLALDPETLDFTGMTRGEVVHVEQVRETSLIEYAKCYRYGFTGQIRPQCLRRDVEVLGTGSARKLWHTKARGFYWLAVQ